MVRSPFVSAAPTSTLATALAVTEMMTPDALRAEGTLSSTTSAITGR